MKRYLLAEFPDVRALSTALRRAVEEKHLPDEILSPHPTNLEVPRDEHRKPIGWVMFVAGAIGAALGYLMQWYSAVYAYPFLSGGRPPHSWQAFMFVPYELTILMAGVCGVLGWIVFAHLARPYHPLFVSDASGHAVQHRYVLVFSHAEKRDWIEQSLAPIEIHEVEA
jgi:hypothetical protein